MDYYEEWLWREYQRAKDRLEDLHMVGLSGRNKDASWESAKRELIRTSKAWLAYWKAKDPNLV